MYFFLKKKKLNHFSTDRNVDEKTQSTVAYWDCAGKVTEAKGWQCFFCKYSPSSPGFKDIPKAEYCQIQGLTFNAESSRYCIRNYSWKLLPKQGQFMSTVIVLYLEQLLLFSLGFTTCVYL